MWMFSLDFLEERLILIEIEFSLYSTFITIFLIEEKNSFIFLTCFMLRNLEASIISIPVILFPEISKIISS
jgi:hypothetical protein